MFKAVVIPVEGPVYEIEVGRPGADDLAVLQEAVGGLIEALAVPQFINGSERATAYCNEEGKYVCKPNMRATDFMVPGVGLFPGDYISGPMVVCGFNPRTGNHAPLPTTVEARVRLIEREAA